MSPEDKAFDALRARAALSGWQVVRTDPRDGPVRMFVSWLGAVRELRSVDDLEAVITSLPWPRSRIPSIVC